MLGDIDTSLKVQKPRLYLAKTDGTLISILSESYNIQYTKYLGNKINTLEFDIPYERDINFSLERSNADSIKYRYLIRMDLNSDSEFFVITKPPQDIMTETEDHMHVTCMLLPIELADKKIYSTTLTSQNATQSLTTLLANTIWTIGTVNSDFDIMFRSFDFSSTSVLDAIFQVADKFKAIIQWDTENRTITFEKEENIGENKGLRIKYGKLLKSLSRDYEVDETVTALKPYGSSGLTVAEANPTSLTTVYDFTYFLGDYAEATGGTAIGSSAWMSDSLCGAVLDFQDLIDSKENAVLDYAETGSTGSSLFLTSHNLATGDWILNSSRKIASDGAYREVTIVSADELSLATGITGQIVGDTIYKYDDTTFRKKLFIKEKYQTQETALLNELTTLNTELVILQNTKEARIAAKIEDTCATSTTTTGIIATSHGMSTGSWVYVPDRDAYREIIYVDVDSVTVTAVTSLSVGDLFYKYTGDPTDSDQNAKIVEINSKQTEINNKNADISSIEIEVTVTTAASVTGNITLLIEDEDNIVIAVTGADTITGVATKVNAAINALYVTGITELKYLSSSTANVVTAYYLSSEDEADVTISYDDTDTTGVGVTLANTNFGISNQISKLNNDMSFANNFTTSQLNELNPFIIEQIWINENYIDAQELYDASKVELAKRYAPQPIIDISMVNLLEILECQHEWEKLVLGDEITIYNDKLNVNVESKIVEIGFNFETTDIRLVIASITDIKDNYQKTLDYFNKAIDTTNDYTIRKVDYNATLTNFDARNDRISTTPADPVVASDGTAIDHIINTDGSTDISFEWTYTGSDDAHNIDGLTIYIRSSITDEEYIFGSSTAREQVINISRTKRSYVLQGVPADRYYTFGIQAYRIVDDDISSTGYLSSNIVQPTLVAENPYQPSSNINYTGNIFGVAGDEISKTTATFIVADGSTSNNVKRADYVVATGSASAEDTINTAINALPAGGGKIVLLDGTFRIDDSIRVIDKVEIELSNGTIIMYATSIAGFCDIFMNDGNTEITIKGGTIDGNKATNPNLVRGIYFDSISESSILNTKIINCSSIGIFMNGDNNIVNNNYIADNDQSGMSIHGSNNLINGNISNNNYDGIRLSTSMNSVILNNSCNDNDTYGIIISNSDDNIINNNSLIGNGQSYHNYYSNIVIATLSDYNNIQNNICRKGTTIIHTATAQTATTSTITLAASASEVDDYYNNRYIEIISGTASGQTSTISDYVGTSRIATVVSWGVIPDNTSVYEVKSYSEYGIEIGTGCDNNLVTNNDIYDSGFTGNLLDNGSGTIVTAGNRS